MRKEYRVTWLPGEVIPQSEYNDDAEILYKKYGLCCTFPEKSIATDYAYRVRPKSFLAETIVFESVFGDNKKEVTQIWSVNRRNIGDEGVGEFYLYDVSDMHYKFFGDSSVSYLALLDWCEEPKK